MKKIKAETNYFYKVTAYSYRYEIFFLLYEKAMLCVFDPLRALALVSYVIFREAKTEKRQENKSKQEDNTRYKQRW